jgi:hypothetical protein
MLLVFGGLHSRLSVLGGIILPDLTYEIAESFEIENFPFSARWHTFNGDTCKNGCHTLRDARG